jgi:hypothetical protein
MRARNIKPAFFTDETIIKLTYVERLLFVGLWCLVDSEGFFEIKPHEIKLQLFPEQKVDIVKMLNRLNRLKLVELHDKYGYLPNFIKHQNPHPNEKKSIVNKGIKNTLIKLHEQSCNYPSTRADIMNHESGIMNHERGRSNESFDKFWKAYPNKKAKQAAMKAWEKITPSNGLVEEMLAAIKKELASDQWKKEKGQFIPHPATWLNGKRWLDEIDEPSIKIDSGFRPNPDFQKNKGEL